LLVDSISRIALASGVLVPIPTLSCAFNLVGIAKNKKAVMPNPAIDRKIVVFI
jgi:hypothetical protein